MQHRIATLAATVFFSQLFYAAALRAESADPPNIVFILVDDMGYGDVGCYNADSKIETPHIDSLASEGMRFTDAHAAGPLCHMSRYGLLTGRYPFRTDVSRWPKHALIDEDQVTIASLLADAGYRTAMVGKWHVGFDENGYDRPLPGGPVDRGFESFFGIRASTDIPPYFYIRDRRAVAPPTEQIAANQTGGWSPIQGAFWRAGGIAPGMELEDVLPRFTEEAVTVIDSHAESAADQPLMLYLAYPAPHTPWLPAEEFVDRSGAGMYGDFMMMVDAMIGRVLAAIESAGMKDNTLVIFSSDNGPTWYPRDEERFGHRSAGGLRGMKADAWEAGHRVPLIARWPQNIAANSSSDQMVSFVDVLATLAAVSGQELPNGAGPDSHDFSGVLLGTHPENQPIRRALALQSGSGAMMIRVGPWKLIDRLGSGGFTQPARVQPVPGGPTGQLYHLGDDPGEQTNLFQEKPAIVRQLSGALQAIKAADQTRPQ